ncbi:hypothetical protein TUM20983_46570 [Mycobacterium antarcticum]|uniref:hypothetical protein n=1 Tax=unclassified Mycolicibacterium TaxID=2636767 RepID=UPI0023887E83|nr:MULTISPECIES: hypothetical protein [unclassified Mycolicibacterium]GLP77547.1 hypothetical protein TUM20983_46570 [Mycolicibacterium sp. TUM20983]GLP82058.1 hypothetical protein TUM20984_34780 [Mycolicibacterium sp. TUM20984]
MGRHQMARSRRRRPPILLVGVVASLAVLTAAATGAEPPAAKVEAKPVVASAPPCCLEVVSVSDAGYSAGSGAALVASAAPAQVGAPAVPAAASRWRVIDMHRILPAGIAPERGLQVKTIFLSRSISIVFPGIHEIGGVRPDALRWHPDGLALDVMIPNPGSAEGIALGNRIVAYALENAARFGLQDAIWRGVYYTPSGSRNTGAGHYDHVHLTTTGGGYPSGREIYYR